MSVSWRWPFKSELVILLLLMWLPLRPLPRSQGVL